MDERRTVFGGEKRALKKKTRQTVPAGFGNGVSLRQVVFGDGGFATQVFFLTLKLFKPMFFKPAGFFEGTWAFRGGFLWARVFSRPFFWGALFFRDVFEKILQSQRISEERIQNLHFKFSQKVQTS